MSYPSGRYSDDTLRLQRALKLNGFDLGPDGADGILGSATIAAVVAAREHYALSPPGPRVDLSLLLALGVSSQTPRKETPVNSTWLSSFVGTTAFKYLVAMAATYLANKLGLDPVEGKASIEGILSQLVGVAMLIWGAWESSRNKVVLNGKRVSVSDLPAEDKSKVAEVVRDNA